MTGCEEVLKRRTGFLAACFIFSLTNGGGSVYNSKPGVIRDAQKEVTGKIAGEKF